MTTALYPRNPVLLVDDEVSLLRSFDNILRNDGINNVLRCSDSREATGIVEQREIDVLVLDLSMPHRSGQDILGDMTCRHPDIPVIIVTAASEVDMAVACMKRGAFDYMVKPVGQQPLLASIRKAIEVRQLRCENAQLKQHLATDTLAHPEAFASIVTQDDKMLSLFMYVECIAPSSQPVFITGETGVGKDLLAKALHDVSARAGRYVTVNVAGLDDTVFSDTLFGHVKGAYTGAETARAGLAETAAGGTLFLDEIGDLSLASQVKLLRFLQEGEYLPMGADLPKKSDARIVVSTNHDIRALLAQGRFREDLYFRLLSHHIRVPPLRERKGDVPLLVDLFISEAAQALNKKRPTPPPELLTYLTTYHFPGNVRELKAMIHNAVTSHRSGVMSVSTFVDHMTQQERPEGATRASSTVGNAGPILFPDELPSVRKTTSLLIREALRRTSGNQVAAARLLGISRQTLGRYSRPADAPRDPKA